MNFLVGHVAQFSTRRIYPFAGHLTFRRISRTMISYDILCVHIYVLCGTLANQKTKLKQAISHSVCLIGYLPDREHISRYNMPRPCIAEHTQ